MMKVRDRSRVRMLRYSAPFLFLLGIPALCYGGGPGATLISVAVLIAALIVAEWLVPAARSDQLHLHDNEAFRLLPLLYIPLQVGVIAWAVWLVSTGAIGAGPFVALTLSVGI